MVAGHFFKTAYLSVKTHSNFWDTNDDEQPQTFIHFFFIVMALHEHEANEIY